MSAQYRSIILYHDDRQKEIAGDMIRELEEQKVWPRPIVTQVEPFEAFYPAEEYHQEYYVKNPYAGYCMVVIAPKLAKFRQKYAERLKV